MTKRERPGYATITLEVPIEVAEWLAVSGEHLGQIAALAAARARYNSDAAKEERACNVKARQAELRNLGRVGYRLFRRFGGGKNITKRRPLIHQIAHDLSVDPQALELAIVAFKRGLETKLRDRRIREIARLYWLGFSNREIADRLKVHKNTVSNYLRDHKAEVQAFAREHPGIVKSLKGKEKGALPGKSLGAFEAVPWEAIKQAGRRA